jgi:hypothetical protein
MEAALNNRTRPVDNAAMSANTVGFQNQQSFGMDRAIGIEKASLDTARYKKTLWFAPVGILFKAAAHAIGFCMEMRRSWLSLLAPHALSHVSTVASNPSSQSQLPNELAYSMDIAICPQHIAAPRSTVASSSGRKAQPQPTPDELAYSMDIAIGERFAVSSSTASISGSHEATTEVPEPIRGFAMAAKSGG